MYVYALACLPVACVHEVVCVCMREWMVCNMDNNLYKIYINDDLLNFTYLHLNLILTIV